MYQLISPAEYKTNGDLHYASLSYQRFDTMFPLSIIAPQRKTLEELNEYLDSVYRDAILVNLEIIIKVCKDGPDTKSWARLQGGLVFFYDNNTELNEMCKMILKMRDIFDICIPKSDAQSVKNINILLNHCTKQLNK